MNSHTLQKLAAFTSTPKGGNPAGVWIGDSLPEPKEMQRIAAEVGFSETAFVAPNKGSKRTVRYYSPEAEVPFCGHATIATGVALGKKAGSGIYQFETTIGTIPVEVSEHNGEMRAALTSVEPKFELPSGTLLQDALSALGWSVDDLDSSIPPARAFGGNWHLVLAVKSKQRLDDLNYDFDKLKQIMLDDDLTTLQLIWRENDELIHSRNPFPVGGVVEDSATGAAAVALGGYLREANIINTPRNINILQGEIMGWPSQLNLSIPTVGGITVSGTAVFLTD
ncbi:PhzF family phenazine biosynthesis protein [Moritella sp. Urea-trap-13]|uniref:PhzF family phenazine biosynthesis protein n=1 Tax=Moritella sp. Urea-trap-13 TaxID=2058327 RepID=UPI000C343F94|nr:PhzF family phenazine biosynthesis isomerase [Moritella sp. Urea-trap-13]PKH07423.1 phenazine biosynthesis protein PhzF [Moritella sp. Urea-trap-13]